MVKQPHSYGPSRSSSAVVGGLFLFATANGDYPLECHMTGRSLLNYLPDRIAFRIGRAFSRQYARGASWERLLRTRTGTRDATRVEILRNLDGEGAKPTLLKPTRFGCRDEVDTWYAASMIRTREHSSARCGPTSKGSSS